MDTPLPEVKPGTWIIYAAEQQDANVRDWAAFERALLRTGFTISCPNPVKGKDKHTFIVVRDPLGKLDEGFKGDKRANILSRRVRQLILSWKKSVKGG